MASAAGNTESGSTAQAASVVNKGSVSGAGTDVASSKMAIARELIVTSRPVLSGARTLASRGRNLDDSAHRVSPACEPMHRRR